MSRIQSIAVPDTAVEAPSLTHRASAERTSVGEMAIRWLLALMLVGSLPPAMGQEAEEPVEDEVRIVLNANEIARQILALPHATRPAGASVEALAAMDEIEQTLRQDLDFSQLFTIQGPEALTVLDLTGVRERDFELYRSLRNELLLLNTFKFDGERLTLEGRMYDLANGRLILGKVYGGGLELARQFAHALADEIVFFFTNKKGIALTSIGFVSDRGHPGVKEVYLMDYDGHGQRRISGHRSLSLAPSWSPQSDGLGYVSFFEGAPGVYWADIQTGKKTAIVADGVHNISPTFAPDGRRVAFARSVGGNFDIFVTNRSGEGLRRITTSGRIDTNPAWSPDGRRIAFTSGRSGSPQVYVMNADGSDVERVSFEGKYNDGAAWHPDGTRLVFATREASGRRFDLSIVDLTTREQRLITRPPGSHESPSFSPDGRWIAFESDRGGEPQIYIIDAEGRHLRQLTTRGQNWSPTWSSYLH